MEKQLKNLILGLGLIMVIPCSKAIDPNLWDADYSRQVRALHLQNHLDINEPLHKTVWVGTHNGFNALDWDLYAYGFFNQTWKPIDQFRFGVRETTFDVYDYNSQLLLCHSAAGLCSGWEKKFRSGLEQIRGWIDEGNKNSVIMLKLEADGDYNQIANQLQAELGDYIYHHDDEGTPVTDCVGLDPINVTKAKVLNAGKNVIVIQTPGKCSDGTYASLVYNGLAYSVPEVSDGSIKRDKFTGVSSPDKCDQIKSAEESYWYYTHPDNSDDIIPDQPFEMLRVFDSTVNVSSDSAPKITRDNVQDYLECGLNIFEMFNFNGHTSGLDPDGSAWEHLKARDLLWSWKSGEPNNYEGNEHCAQHRADGRFNDQECSEHFRYICETTGSTLLLIEESGPWESGDAACNAKWGSKFFAPTNPRDNKRLKDLKAELGVDNVWINYHDRHKEGLWQVGNRLVSGEESFWINGLTKSDAHGRTGSYQNFDSFDAIELMLLTGKLNKINTIAIQTGARVDRIELHYENGRIDAWGGNGGGRQSLAVADNDYFTSVKVCSKLYNGDFLLTGVEFKTATGQALSGGDTQTGCVDMQHKGVLTGLHGLHTGVNTPILALGAYFLDLDFGGTSYIANGDGIVLSTPTNQFLSKTDSGTAHSFITLSNTSDADEIFIIHREGEGLGCFMSTDWVKISSGQGGWLSKDPNSNALGFFESQRENAPAFKIGTNSVDDGSGCMQAGSTLRLFNYTGVGGSTNFVEPTNNGLQYSPNYEQHAHLLTVSKADPRNIPKAYKLSIVSPWNKNFVALEGGGNDVVADRDWIDLWETFTAEFNSEQKCLQDGLFIQIKIGNHYLRVDRGNVDARATSRNTATNFVVHDRSGAGADNCISDGGEFALKAGDVFVTVEPDNRVTAFRGNVGDYGRLYLKVL